MQETLFHLIESFIKLNYATKEQEIILLEIALLSKNFKSISSLPLLVGITYDSLQDRLSKINEKQHIRKLRGVYYTPKDLVEFTIINAIKQNFGTLTPTNIQDLALNDINIKQLCFNRSIFDPTCGVGEFLLFALSLKFELLANSSILCSKANINKIVQTIYGNDINPESILIVKLRIILLVAHKFGAKAVKGIVQTMQENFTCFDAVAEKNQSYYDIIVGNPPYVEDKKYLSETHARLDESFGNIYANILVNSMGMLSEKGTFAFIIPISYIATPRMKKLRSLLSTEMRQQYILNYADRPDCLFVGVHQKLCILIAKKNQFSEIYTSGYQYWYKSERPLLFSRSNVTNNDLYHPNFIPKLGNAVDSSIYKKVANLEDSSNHLSNLMSNTGSNSIYVNMRATFWMKVFINPHIGGEYKKFTCSDPLSASLAFCILNSSLFWWHWVMVSDCWHITNKELTNFLLPENINQKCLNKAKSLAFNLEEKLESTKRYVGTKQVEYEYKHKFCIDQIHAIDDFVGELYGLTDEEKTYIKFYQYKYRMGEDKNEGN